ncbi:MAG: glycosyltransferase [Leptolyngbyaceae cyanobacterium SL_7_1]|nr:glycosyltransferase [Leptolyngbyaceae cyanobacterium SL_7_1]
MKVILISTYDVEGGAARAAHRLHQGLRQIGQDVLMLSRYKVSSDDTIGRINPLLGVGIDRLEQLQAIQDEYINANRTNLSNTLFSLPYPGFDLSQLACVQEADIINLHWVAYFQSPHTIKKLLDLGKPIVWTLHDMWAFTGGCHYSSGCTKYKDDCGSCPQLLSDPFNIAALVLKDKIESILGENLTIVTPSRWLADCARESRLFKHNSIHVIPYGIEADVFTPLPKPDAKQQLGIDSNKITLLFGAGTGVELRKGFAELVEAVQYCLENLKFQQLVVDGLIEILCFGYPSQLLDLLAIPVRSLGVVTSDHQLRTIYSAADYFILPSLEDNLPNTMMEAMSCGTPVIAFDSGGIPDMVENGITGRLVPTKDTRKLAHAILDCVFDLTDRQRMSIACREVIGNKYSISVQAERYVSLFQKLLEPRTETSTPLMPNISTN